MNLVVDVPIQFCRPITHGCIASCANILQDPLDALISGERLAIERDRAGAFIFAHGVLVKEKCIFAPQNGRLRFVYGILSEHGPAPDRFRKGVDR